MISKLQSRIEPKKVHVAMLNSLQSIYLMGGGSLKITRIGGHFSKTLFNQQMPITSQIGRIHMQKLDEMYTARWKAKGYNYAITIEEAVKQLEKEGISDLFLNSLSIIIPYTRTDESTLENIEGYVQFNFKPHPFKPSTFKRLKGQMPSYQLYAKMKELREELSQELTDATRKRWRDILLVNDPIPYLSKDEVIGIWHDIPCAFLLRENSGTFTLMELGEVSS